MARMGQHDAGEYLARLRRAARLSQEQAAERTGVSSRSIRNWERGAEVPRGRALSAYLNILGGSMDEWRRLMSGDAVAAPVLERELILDQFSSDELEQIVLAIQTESGLIDAIRSTIHTWQKDNQHIAEYAAQDSSLLNIVTRLERSPMLRKIVQKLADASNSTLSNVLAFIRYQEEHPTPNELSPDLQELIAPFLETQEGRDRLKRAAQQFIADSEHQQPQ